ncbi:MAG TPA: glycosyl transferase, partial [Lachnospiraceae bacterium]|nr:glycosyl transferase [Lachnospiraceae bacterium]
VQLFFIGLLGEYVLAINSRVLDRPLVVEEERLNFNVRPDPEPDPAPAGSEQPGEQGA